MGKYIYLVFFVLIAILSGTVYFLYKDNADKQASIALLEHDVKALRDSNEAIISRHNEILHEYTFYRGKVAGIAEEQKRKETELEAYRGRLSSLSLSKPGLIEIKANKAVGKVFENFEAETTVGTNNK